MFVAEHVEVEAAAFEFGKLEDMLHEIVVKAFAVQVELLALDVKHCAAACFEKL